MQPSSIFNYYQNELERSLSELEEYLEQARSPKVPLEERKTTLSHAEGSLNDAANSMHSLELEAYSESIETAKEEAIKKTNQLKARLEKLRKDWKEAKLILSEQSDQLERSDLLRDVVHDLESGSQEQRERLIGVSGKLEKGIDTLKTSRRTIEETEQVSRGILEDLSAQRRTIQHAMEGLSGIDAALLRSRGLLSSMTRRALANKLILYLIAIVFGFGAVFMVFSKFR
eukprot:jgi/Galph1/564/GphlegSOOS_G5434.1